MTLFWFVAVVLVVAALLFLLPPLLAGKKAVHAIDRDKVNIDIYKDKLAELDQDLRNGVLSQDQYKTAQQELERGLLEDMSGNEASEAAMEKVTNPVAGPVSATFVGFGVPVLAIGLYLLLGGGENAFQPEQAPPTVAADTEGHQGTIDAMVAQLEQRLASNPNDAEGWIMLARSYYFQHKNREAANAFAKAMDLGGKVNADLLADYADALAVSNNKDMTGKPYELVKKALTMQPFHQKSLWLAGTAAYQQQDFNTALAYWETLLKVLPPGSEPAEQMQRNLQEVRTMMANAGMAVPESSVPTSSATGATGLMTKAGQASVTGTVKLDEKLGAQVTPNDTVFIFARAVNGPRMPLAILRKQASELPINFTLDDSLAMNPAMKLSKVSEVVIGARISKSGNAMPQPGDLEGQSPVVSVGTTEIPIIIDHVVGQAAPAPMQSKAASAAGASVSGTVKLAPELTAKADPSDTVFIFARAANGPRMPLAILRKQVNELPFSFTLDDSMAMNPALKLSNFGQVVIGARVSKSGNAMPQAGDLEGKSQVVAIGSTDIPVVINSVVP
jgi:cytochrome c-type biogenesis protein CcmH